MNTKEQRVKLWCDVFKETVKYNNKTVKPLDRISAKQKADEAVKSFDERFNTTKTTLKDNDLVPEPKLGLLTESIGRGDSDPWTIINSIIDDITYFNTCYPACNEKDLKKRVKYTCDIIKLKLKNFEKPKKSN